MALSEFDVYIDGTGYVLARDPNGQLYSSSLREDRRSPVSNYFAEGERWSRASFRFDGGEGAEIYDGTNRYRRGYRVDTRGGNAVRGPVVHISGRTTDYVFRVTDTEDVGEYEVSNAAAGYDGVGVKFVSPGAGALVKHVNLLVRRKPDMEYNAAGNVTVEIRADVAGTPGAVVGVATTFSLKDVYRTLQLFGSQAWAAGEWFNMPVTFAGTGIVLAPATTYWLCVTNAQAYKLYWAKDTENNDVVSFYDGIAWGAGASQNRPFFKLNWTAENDAPVREFMEFTGSDNMRRLYAAVGAKVMYWRVDTSSWQNSKGDFVGEVSDLCVFNSLLFACQGAGNPIWNHTGATATTVWANVVGINADCLAVHDNMLWRADGATLEGSTTGTAWGAGTVIVGDPGTMVQSMISHGGKLFAMKEEGVFEISYPSTYPTSGSPTCNLLLDFKTDRAARPWALDWQSGLYFPGTFGLLEYKNGVLRDIWNDRIDPDYLYSKIDTSKEIWSNLPRPPLHPTMRVDNRGQFMSACGTTRGLVASISYPYLTRSGLYWWDGRGWHSLYHNTDYGEQISAVHLEPIGSGKGRLWFNIGSDIAYMIMPTWTANRRYDLDADFITQIGYLELPAFDGGKPSRPKDFYSLEVRYKNSGTATGTIQIWYLIDYAGEDTPISTASWTTLATIGAANEPFASVPLPAQTTGHDIRILLGVTGTGTSDSVEIETVDLLWLPLLDPVEYIQVTVELAPDLRLLRGAVDHRSPGEILQDLYDAMDDGEPVTYLDENGQGWYVRITGITKQIDALAERPTTTADYKRFQGRAIVSMIRVASWMDRAAAP